MPTLTERAPRRIADLPGPRGLPLVGNSLQVRLSQVHLDVERWGRAYGPLFRFRLGGTQVLGITDHELIASVLKDRPEGFRRNERTRDVAREMGLRPGVFSAEGQAWRDQRRMVMASFAPQQVRAYLPTLLKVVQRLQGRWQQAARSGAPIALQADLMRYTVDGVAGLAFGTDINTLQSDHEVIQAHLDKIFPKLFRRIFAPVPYWRWLRLPSDRALARSVQAINAAIAQFIAQARERMQAQPGLRERPSNLLEAMIAAADQGDSGLSDHDVAGNVFTLLLAGEDTTANTLAWMIHLLHANPLALQAATDEVLRLPRDIAAWTCEHIDALATVEACALETLRLKPVAPFISFDAVHDTTLAGIAVPAGTVVWCVMRHDTLSEAHFAQPARFDHQRWLSPGAAHSPKRVAMPFGAGPRVCPGRYLAMLEIKLAIAMLLSRFEIESVATHDGRAPREQMSFSMAPLGLTLRLRERRDPTLSAPGYPRM